MSVLDLDGFFNPDFMSDWNQRVLPFKKLRIFKVLKWASNSDDPGAGNKARQQEVTSLDDADIVSSQFKDDPDKHMVVLDIDIPAVLIPSSTPGHSHLYIQSSMDWETYQRLLVALSDAGVIQPGYAGASITRGFTAVRLPWVSK